MILRARHVQQPVNVLVLELLVVVVVEAGIEAFEEGLAAVLAVGFDVEVAGGKVVGLFEVLEEVSSIGVEVEGVTVVGVVEEFTAA